MAGKHHFLLLIIAASSACSSISGKKLVHDQTGRLIDVRNVGGLPIVVQNPTRAAFILTTTVYDVAEVHTEIINDVVRTRRKPLGRVTEQTLSEKPIMLGPSEIYTIDPHRPAAGTLDYSIELQNQYPTKLTGKLDDKTLSELRQLAKDLADVALKASGVTPPVDKESGESATVDRTLVQKKLSLVVIDLATGQVSIQDLAP